MCYLKYFFVLMMMVGFASCNEAEETKSIDMRTENLYFDYRITAEEGGENVTCKLQFKLGSSTGDAIKLNDSCTVELDGVAIEADSAKITGTYYELVQLLAKFSGEHSIVFTAADGKKFKEDFKFMPFSLAQPLPDTISRKPFTIRLKNIVSEEKPVRLIMIDTAFANNDVNELVEIKNGELNITTGMLNQLSNGPISLEIQKDERVKLKQPTKIGGRLIMSYTLKREFELVD